MSVLTVVLANPHPIVRSNLRALLDREPDFRVVAEAANGREAILLSEYKRPSAVILDAGLQTSASASSSAIEVARAITRSDSKVAILFYGTHIDAEYVSTAFDSGARAYVACDSANVDLPTALRVVGRHGRYISPCVTARLISQEERSASLTTEEIRIYSLLAAGCDLDELKQHLPVPLPNVDKSAIHQLPAVIACSIEENLGIPSHASSESV